MRRRRRKPLVWLDRGKQDLIAVSPALKTDASPLKPNKMMFFWRKEEPTEEQTLPCTQGLDVPRVSYGTNNILVQASSAVEMKTSSTQGRYLQVRNQFLWTEIVQLVVVWACCPVWCSVVGLILLWVSSRGDFSLGFNVGSDSIP